MKKGCDLLSKVSTFGIWNNSRVRQDKEPSSCDLLSKVSTFGIWNNWHNLHYPQPLVVTCSQKLVPLVSGTTGRRAGTSGKKL